MKCGSLVKCGSLELQLGRTLPLAGAACCDNKNLCPQAPWLCHVNESLLGSCVQESRKNQLRDFVDIAGPLGVSHFLILTATDNAAYLRVAKTPRVRLKSNFPLNLPR